MGKKNNSQLSIRECIETEIAEYVREFIRKEISKQFSEKYELSLSALVANALDNTFSSVETNPVEAPDNLSVEAPDEPRKCNDKCYGPNAANYSHQFHDSANEFGNSPQDLFANNRDHFGTNVVRENILSAIYSDLADAERPPMTTSIIVDRVDETCFVNPNINYPAPKSERDILRDEEINGDSVRKYDYECEDCGRYCTSGHLELNELKWKTNQVDSEEADTRVDLSKINHPVSSVFLEVRAKTRNNGSWFDYCQACERDEYSSEYSGEVIADNPADTVTPMKHVDSDRALYCYNSVISFGVEGIIIPPEMLQQYAQSAEFADGVMTIVTISGVTKKISNQQYIENIFAFAKYTKADLCKRFEQLFGLSYVYAVNVQSEIAIHAKYRGKRIKIAINNNKIYNLIHDYSKKMNTFGNIAECNSPDNYATIMIRVAQLIDFEGINAVNSDEPDITLLIADECIAIDHSGKIYELDNVLSEYVIGRYDEQDIKFNAKLAKILSFTWGMSNFGQNPNDIFIALSHREIKGVEFTDIYTKYDKSLKRIGDFSFDKLKVDPAMTERDLFTQLNSHEQIARCKKIIAQVYSGEVADIIIYRDGLYAFDARDDLIATITGKLFTEIINDSDDFRAIRLWPISPNPDTNIFNITDNAIIPREQDAEKKYTKLSFGQDSAIDKKIITRARNIYGDSNIAKWEYCDNGSLILYDDSSDTLYYLSSAKLISDIMFDILPQYSGMSSTLLVRDDASECIDTADNTASECTNMNTDEITNESAENTSEFDKLLSETDELTKPSAKKERLKYIFRIIESEIIAKIESLLQ